MLVQDYMILLANGRAAMFSEPASRPWKDTVWNRYVHARPYTLFRVGNETIGFRYFWAKDIIQILRGMPRNEGLSFSRLEVLPQWEYHEEEDGGDED